MSYFRTCPRCGLHLDPGERCECVRKLEQKKRSARSAATLRTAKRNMTHVSASSVMHHAGGVKDDQKRIRIFAMCAHDPE